MKNKIYILFSLVMALLVFGCAGGTTIKSNPSGAKVYLDGQYKGATPYYHIDITFTGAPRMLTLKKEGYKDFEFPIRRNLELFWMGGISPPIGVPIPIFVYPKDGYNFELGMRNLVNEDNEVDP